VTVLNVKILFKGTRDRFSV